MKPLLLTLVVVAIVCLDLGYTLKCYSTPISVITETCPKGMNLCYGKFHFGKFKIFRTRGCTDKCPPGPGTICCDTNKCNK
uniref:Three-finger toxin n=1 Tax=Calliophis bivirgatus TaxID=8633 RepID=A0A898IN41_CALBG|nr:three-finger toxin [Calliophis bivirgatus]